MWRIFGSFRYLPVANIFFAILIFRWNFLVLAMYTMKSYCSALPNKTCIQIRVRLKFDFHLRMTVHPIVPHTSQTTSVNPGYILSRHTFLSISAQYSLSLSPTLVSCVFTFCICFPLHIPVLHCRDRLLRQWSVE